MIVEESNLYVQQNGREFQTNKKEMNLFLGINYAKTVNILPTITSCWEFRQYIEKQSIENAMTKKTIESILKNLNFSNEVDRIEKCCNIRLLITHFYKPIDGQVKDGSSTDGQA